MNAKGTGRTTLEDVARAASVSRATTSLVVRDSLLAARAIMQRALDSIEQLGHVYDRAAATPRTERLQAVGLVVTNITSPFFFTRERPRR